MRVATTASVCVLVSGLASGLTHAAESGFADPKMVATAPVSGVSSMGYVTVALAIVLALIYGAAWMLRRVKSFSGARQSMNIVEAVSVGPKERVVLVRVRNQHVLVGVAPGRVNMLLDMGKTEEPQPNEPAKSDAPQMPSFKSLLKRSMGLS
ncbi:MAG TPA: flagellar biosynthetic protein FliO [Steroidobacteraceae bacterium]|nr:flagellar biosynthetic protein FliO [Steroidobacteraceae bacterium]